MIASTYSEPASWPHPGVPWLLPSGIPVQGQPREFQTWLSSLLTTCRMLGEDTHKRERLISKSSNMTFIEWHGLRFFVKHMDTEV